MKETYPFLLLFLLFVGVKANGQSSEFFEDESVNSSSFTSNGEIFDVTSAEGFDVYELAGSGWNGTAPDAKFIDNSGFTSNGGGTSFTIKQDDSDDFLVIDLYLFCARNNLTAHSGTLTITGRRNNSDIYSFTKSSGFSNVQTFTPNNGFTYLNFATEGAADYSDDPIDELVISSSGDLDYLALDAFQWDLVILPVELINFNGLLSENKIHLLWETELEFNNEKFEIQRSVDGVSFNKIGEVLGNGTSYVKKEYSFIDKKPLSNINYYRLKQMDIDGKFDFSQIISINYEEGNTQMGRLYPNPAFSSPIINIDYYSLSNEKAYISVFDSSGKRISNQIQQISIGANILNFATSNLKEGIYIIKIETESNSVFKVLQFN